jgi:hypothetical protein
MSARKKAISKKSGRRVSKAPRKAVRKGTKRRATASGPKPVKTGRGPGPADVARQVVALLRSGQAHDVEEKWLAPGIVSVEGVGVALAWTGKKAVLQKYRTWEADHEIHDLRIEGPWVGASGFSLKYGLDATQKSTGQRIQMEEIAVYTVRDGKIVREEFHFATGA